MADTLPDVNLTPVAYKDLYSESGIASGTKVLVQNKAGTFVKLQLQAAQPADTSTDGVYVVPNAFVEITAGENGLWGIGNGDISIQVVS